MATKAQADAYQAARGNEDWADLEDDRANALLVDAGDYIRGAYRIRADLDEQEQRLLDGLVCRLAGMFAAKAPEALADAGVKRENKALGDMKKEVEYFSPSADPYPYITAAIRPLLAPANSGSFSLYVGKVTG